MGGTLTADLVEFEAKRALEGLNSDKRIENQRFASVLVCPPAPPPLAAEPLFRQRVTDRGVASVSAALTDAAWWGWGRC